MNLRESLDDRYGEGFPDPLEGRETFLHVCGLMQGFREATGLWLVASTDGPTIRLHNLSADTRSAEIHRSALGTTAEAITAVRAQLDAMPYWEPEDDTWGPDPWLERA